MLSDSQQVELRLLKFPGTQTTGPGGVSEEDTMDILSAMLRFGHSQDTVHELSPRPLRLKLWVSGVGKEDRRPGARGLSGDSKEAVRGDRVSEPRARALWDASYRFERHRGPQRWRSRNFSGTGARASLGPRPAAGGWRGAGGGVEAEAGSGDSRHPHTHTPAQEKAALGVAQSRTARGARTKK